MIETTLQTINNNLDKMFINMNLADYNGNQIDFLYWKTQIQAIMKQANNA